MNYWSYLACSVFVTRYSLLLVPHTLLASTSRFYRGVLVHCQYSPRLQSTAYTSHAVRCHILAAKRAFISFSDHRPVTAVDRSRSVTTPMNLWYLCWDNPSRQGGQQPGKPGKVREFHWWSGKIYVRNLHMFMCLEIWRIPALYWKVKVITSVIFW